PGGIVFLTAARGRNDDSPFGGQRLNKLATGAGHVEDYDAARRQRGEQRIVFAGRDVRPDQVELRLLVERSMANQKDKEEIVRIEFALQGPEDLADFFSSSDGNRFIRRFLRQHFDLLGGETKLSG